MSILVVRHALSEANNQESLAFGTKTAHLMPAGVDRAKELGDELRNTFGIDTKTEPVAVSELLRTQQTAKVAGFRVRMIYSALNEVETGLEYPELREYLMAKRLPPKALEAAQRVLENPPLETIWVAHGLVIAGLTELLGVADGQRFIPKFCEIRELPITP